WRGGVIGGGKSFGARPFGENAEEAGDVLHDLAGVLIGEVAPEARLPDFPCAGDLLACVIVVCSVETFHRRPHGRFPPLRAPGLRSRNPTDDAGPNRDLHLLASPSQGSPVVLKTCGASARHLVLGDRELVALSPADHELALAAVGDLAGDRIVEEAVLQS